MAKRWLALMSTALLVVAACGAPGDSPAPGTPAPGTPAPGTPEPGTPDPGTPAPGTPDPGTSPDISGTLNVAGWSAGDVEDGILRNVLDEFEAMYPGVTVEFDVVAGEYPAIVLTQLGAGDYPDLFYVNQAFAQDWIDQGVLADLNQRAQDDGFSLDNFFPGFLNPFQRDGATYAFPKDASMLGMQTNDAMLADAGVSIPTTTDELVAAAQALRDNGVDTPLCFAAEWQRAGAFVHGFGGGLVDDNGAPAIDSSETRAGLQWYLDQYHNGLAARASDIGAGWCGEAFGTEAVAIAFEGNWIGPYMESTYPDVAYTVSPIPAGPAGQATLSFTVGYGMHPNTPNPEASWALLTYLTGQEGMQEWVNGGLVLPARDDVNPTSPLQQQYAAFAEFATAGEGVTPQWSRVSDAFNGAIGAASEPGGTVDQIVDATLPVLQEVTAQ